MVNEKLVALDDESESVTVLWKENKRHNKDSILLYLSMSVRHRKLSLCCLHILPLGNLTLFLASLIVSVSTQTFALTPEPNYFPVTILSLKH